VVNTLRLWSAKAAQKFNFQFCMSSIMLFVFVSHRIVFDF